MKDEFEIKTVSKKQAAEILLKYHYLKDESNGFKSGFNYGLFMGDEFVGVIIYTGFPVPELAKGCFGLGRNEQDGLLELSRLCLTPEVQAEEHNLASWFVSRSIRMLRKDTRVRAILSYADDNHHKGTVYRACNFGYYGLTAQKSDFWIKQDDGSLKKHSRGSVRGLDGEWRPRSRKHRFLLVYDKTLTCQWNKPNASNQSEERSDDSLK
ncbi:MAG: hypothetical protein H8E10_09265 [Desulfobacterales bacterium]|nr:hypothetical protein [Desulfobacterales bacterium]